MPDALAWRTMTTLYVARHPLGVTLYTRLSESEQATLGNISILMIEGENYGGLNYAYFAQIAATTGRIESEDLHDL